MACSLSEALQSRIERADDPERVRALTTLRATVLLRRLSARLLARCWRAMTQLCRQFAWLTAVLVDVTVDIFRQSTHSQASA